MRGAVVSRAYRRWDLLERWVDAALEGLLQRMSGWTSLNTTLACDIKDFPFVQLRKRAKRTRNSMLVLDPFGTYRSIFYENKHKK